MYEKLTKCFSIVSSRIRHNDDIKVNPTCVTEELATRSGVDVLNKSRNREKICKDIKRESTRK